MKKIEGRVMALARGYAGSVYTVEVDRVDREQWNRIVPKFDDANLMQTWSYGADRWGENNLSHILLRKNSEIVSAAQVVIKTVPFLSAGICRVRGGPVWQLQGTDKDPEILHRMLRALREVFVSDRGLFLQIFPAGIDDGVGTARRVFEEEGFELNPDDGDPQTALIDLSYPMDHIRRSLKKKWRQHLVHAEHNDLTIEYGTSHELLEAVGKLYTEGLRRRRFAPVVNVDQLKQTQRNLPEALKMRVMLCEYHGEPVSGIAVPFLGNTAQALLSGTANKGLKLYGSYLLHWRMLGWLKEHGCRWYDLDGINPAAQSGDTQFKLAFAGRLGVQAERLGRFETCDEGTSLAFVKAGVQFRKAYMGMRVAFSSSLPAALSKIASRTSLTCSDNS